MGRHIHHHVFARAAARLVLATLIAAAACTHNNSETETEDVYRPEPIPVHVKNENFLDMNVAIVAGGVSRRLGQVSGNGSADFRVNWNVANGQAISVTATPIGQSGRFTSQGLSLRPGQMIDFRIGSVLRQSAAVVRDM
ncbi:MAG: hypothetical protein ACREBE_06615 [bacterium]